MKKKMWNSKRFTLVVASFLVVSAVSLIAVLKGMEGTAAACVTVLGGVVGWYTQNETARPSESK